MRVEGARKGAAASERDGLDQSVEEVEGVAEIIESGNSIGDHPVRTVGLAVCKSEITGWGRGGEAPTRECEQSAPWSH